MNPPADRSVVEHALTASVDDAGAKVTGLTVEIKKQGRRQLVFLVSGANVLLAVALSCAALVYAVAALNSQQQERSANAQQAKAAAEQARDAATAAKAAAESAAATLTIVQEATGPEAQARSAASIRLILQCQQAYTLNAVRGTAIPANCPTVTP